MRGIVFTLDATFALILVMIFASTIFTLLEAFSQPEPSLPLSRLARDVYEVRYYGAPGPFEGVLEDARCGSAQHVGATTALVYGNITDATEQSAVGVVVKRVCVSG